MSSVSHNAQYQEFPSSAVPVKYLVCTNTLVTMQQEDIENFKCKFKMMIPHLAQFSSDMVLYKGRTFTAFVDNKGHISTKASLLLEHNFLCAHFNQEMENSASAEHRDSVFISNKNHVLSFTLLVALYMSGTRWH